MTEPEVASAAAKPPGMVVWAPALSILGFLGITAVIGVSLSFIGRGRANRVLVSAVVALTFVLLGTGPAAAETPDDPKTVWIYGSQLDLTTDGCAFKDLNPVLQVKREGQWATVAKGKRFLAKAACKDNGEFRYKYKYRFTLEDLGMAVPGEPYSLLEARQFWMAYGKPISRPFVKTVLPSKEAHAKWLLDGFLESLGEA